MANSKKIGNRFQDEIASSIPKNLFYKRLRDLPNGRFKHVDNEGDFIVNANHLLILECKTTKETNFPIDNIRMGQLWKMINAVTKDNVVAGYIIEYRKLDVTYYIPVSEFVYWYLTNSRSNLPISWVKEHGYKVARKLKITRHVYGIVGLLDWIEVNDCANNQ